MTPAPPLNLPAKLSVAALFVLGMLGGSLIVAYSGFETSPRRGGSGTFVAVPEAYILAAILYLMSWLAMTAILRDRGVPMGTYVAASVACGAMAWGLVRVLS